MDAIVSAQDAVHREDGDWFSRPTRPDSLLRAVSREGLPECQKRCHPHRLYPTEKGWDRGGLAVGPRFLRQDRCLESGSSLTMSPWGSTRPRSERGRAMLSVFCSPSRYTQGRGATA